MEYEEGEHSDDGFLGFSDSEDEGAVPGESSQNSGGGNNDLQAEEEEEERVPWLRERSFKKTSSPLVQLHNEVLDLCDLLAPTRAEKHLRDTVTKLVRAKINELLPGYSLEIFGSERTRLFLPESDVDMVIIPPNKEELPVQRIRQNLFRIADTFKQSEEALTSVEVIAKARIPLCKMRFGNLQVDISFSNDSGPRSAKLMLEFMEEMPALRPMILVLKYFLCQRDMNETYTGGMGSFLLQLMIVSFLQQRKREGEFLRYHRNANLGSMLVEFLKLYGVDFNYEEVGISVLGGGMYYRKYDRGFYSFERPHVLSCENPLDTTLDVGKNTYRMDVIKESFAQAYYKIHKALTNWRPGKSILASVIRPDPLLLSRPFSSKHIFRTDVFERKRPRTSDGQAARASPPSARGAVVASRMGYDDRKRGRWSKGIDERPPDYGRTPPEHNKRPRYS